MVEGQKSRGDACDLATLIRLFGPPPLFDNEKFERFEEMAGRLTACLQPEDFIVCVFVYQLAIETWCFMRWRRYEAVMANRLHKGQLDIEAQRKKIEALQRSVGKEPPELFKDAPNDACRHFALEPLAESISVEAKALQEHIDENRMVGALAGCIEKLRQFEFLANGCSKHSNDALSQIEWYRATLAIDLREKAAEIIETDSKTIDATAEDVTLVPTTSDEQNESP